MKIQFKFRLFYVVACVVPALFFLSQRYLSGQTTAFPDTPAGVRAGEVLELLNGTSSRTAEDYIQNEYTPAFRDAFPMVQHMQIFTSIKQKFGSLELTDILSDKETEIRFQVGSKNRDAGLNIMIRVENEPPHRIVSMGIRPGQSPSSAGEGKTSRTKAIQPKNVSPEELDRFISKKTEANEFSGVVLIARDGTPLFHKAYGYASKRFQVPNKAGTKFNLGSINKSFTAVAILQLIEQGKLAIDDPIGKYLDIFPSEIAEKVTIRHLLKMSSGWGDYWALPAFLKDVSRLREVPQYMDFVKDMSLDFEPGSNSQHSNTGYEVAGAIIEKITNMDYFEYIRRNIYTPAGMSESGSFDRDGPVENLAAGYTNMNQADPEGKDYRWENTYLLTPKGSPAGGGYSTAMDMLKYQQALTGYKLLSREMTHFYFNRMSGRPGDVLEFEGRYTAAGGAPGVSALFAIDFDSGLTFIILSNYDHPAGISLANEIMSMF